MCLCIYIYIRTKELCDGTTDPNLGITCGRPLGFSFNTRTGDLYIADAYLGLQVVGPNGGLATVLATSAEGIRFRFLDGVDVDQLTSFVYFSSGTTTYDLRYTYMHNFNAIYCLCFNIRDISPFFESIG